MMREAQLATIHIGESANVTGKMIGELRLRTNTGASIVGIQRGEENIINPGPDEELRAGDEVLLLGSQATFGFRAEAFVSRRCPLAAAAHRHPTSDESDIRHPSLSSVLLWGVGEAFTSWTSELQPIVHLALARLDQRLRERDQCSVDRSSPSLPLYTSGQSD